MKSGAFLRKDTSFYRIWLATASLSGNKNVKDWTNFLKNSSWRETVLHTRARRLAGDLTLWVLFTRDSKSQRRHAMHLLTCFKKVHALQKTSLLGLLRVPVPTGPAEPACRLAGGALQPLPSHEAGAHAPWVRAPPLWLMHTALTEPASVPTWPLWQGSGEQAPLVTKPHASPCWTKPVWAFH